MWKRWSRSQPATPEASKSSVPGSPATHSPEESPSQKKETVLEDAGVNGAVDESAQSAPTDEKHDSIPTAQIPVTQIPPTDTLEHPVPSVSNTEPADSVSSTPPIPDATSSSPSIADPTSFPHVPSPAQVNSGDSNDPQSAGTPVEPPKSADTLAPPAPHDHPPTRSRRLSFRSFAFFYGRDKQLPSTLPTPTPKIQTTELVKSKVPKPKLSRSQKEALSSAVALRTLIIGPSSLSSPPDPPAHLTNLKSRHSKPTSPPPSFNLKKVKAQLLKPKSANAIILQLRRLPLPDGPSFHPSGRVSAESLVTHPDAGGAPIHAVCLACTDEEADLKHFSRLRTGHNLSPDALSAASSSGLPSVGTASLESLIPVLRDLHLVSLLASPDLGFGQPVSDDDDTSGPLSGSVPSAGTVVDGFEEITKQLMMLGFATSKAVFPDHTGIYPPEDRMSVLTYWWGLELVLPEPSVVYLSKAKSISNTLLNFLSALALFNNGVREVLPFIRYVSNFANFEWSAIQGQDKGRGVVCAATWVMPAAMVPRPWDFPPRPKTVPAPNFPTAPTSPASPKTSAGKTPDPPIAPPQESRPTAPPDSGMLYPSPTIPMMPQLMVTPATLPRGFGFPAPQDAAA